MHLMGSRMSPRPAKLAVITPARKKARARGRWTPIPGKSGMPLSARATQGLTEAGSLSEWGRGWGSGVPRPASVQVRVGRFGKGPFELKLPLTYC
jgi:hypothetical protein